MSWLSSTVGDMFSGHKKKNNARTEEEIRQAKIASGMGEIDKAYSMFSPKFYTQRAQEYTNYAMPQLGEQTREQQKMLLYNMFNRGLQNSSAMQTGTSKLNREVDTQKQGIIDTGYQQAQNLRKQVESQRGNVIGQLQASGDPSLAAQQALSTASMYSAPSSFAPLGNLFGSLANLYANNQIGNAYNQNYQPRYGMNPQVNSSPLGTSSYRINR